MQINDKHLELSRRAEVALNRLTSKDKDKIIKSIKKVLDVGLQSPYTAKLKGMENTFLVRAGQDLRIIFLLENGYIRIIDIARPEKIKQLSKISKSQEDEL